LVAVDSAIALRIESFAVRGKEQRPAAAPESSSAVNGLPDLGNRYRDLLGTLVSRGVDHQVLAPSKAAELRERVKKR
jgi:hypothetical protein